MSEKFAIMYVSVPVNVHGHAHNPFSDKVFTMMIKKKTTIYDVADQAGVSRQTVSRVMNNRPDVAPETRKRVLEVIQKLGYQPSQLARGLSQGTSSTLGVVGYGIYYYGPSRTLSVVERQAAQHGYSLALSLTHQLENIDLSRILGDLLAQHVDGIIWAIPQIGDIGGRFSDAVKGITVPVVCANMLPHSSFSLVDSDNFAGGVLATKHLIDQGNQRIGIITGPSGWLVSKQRTDGWIKAQESARIPINQDLMVEGDWSAASGYHGLSYLLEKNSNMDALFACNDQMALGALRAASKLGINIPGDLALVGYDNIPEAEFFSPPLTTVRQNFSDQGKIMVDEIERRIREIKAGKADVSQTELLSPALVVRESSIRR